MNARHLAALVSTLAVCACGGGGGSAPPGATPVAPVPIATAAPTSAPQSQATIPMTIAIPRGKPSSSARGPRFLSPNAASIAIYDGPTLLYVANLALDSTPPFATIYAKTGNESVAFGTCTFTSTEATCGLTITATTGAHSFDVIVYPVAQTPGANGAPPAFTGVISSEGELSVTLSVGANPGQTLTLLGVADKVIFAGLSEAAYNAVVTYGYRLEDSTNAQIVQPGNAYDNGPITITAAPSGIVTIAPSSIATPPAGAGDQSFNVTCVNAAGGTVTISFNARTSPNTAYTSGLTYTTANYSAAVIQTTPFTCDAASATIPITVQSKKRS